MNRLVLCKTRVTSPTNPLFDDNNLLDTSTNSSLLPLSRSPSPLSAAGSPRPISPSQQNHLCPHALLAQGQCLHGRTLYAPGALSQQLRCWTSHRPRPHPISFGGTHIHLLVQCLLPMSSYPSPTPDSQNEPLRPRSSANQKTYSSRCPVDVAISLLHRGSLFAGLVLRNQLNAAR